MKLWDPVKDAPPERRPSVFAHPGAGRARLQGAEEVKEEPLSKETADYLRKAFDNFDTDKSGYIEPSELRAALTVLGVSAAGFTPEMMGMQQGPRTVPSHTVHLVVFPSTDSAC